MQPLHAVLAVLSFVFSALSSPAVIANPSDLDPAFGSDGKVLLGPGGPGTPFVLAQPDGRIIVFGAGLRRLNADGTPDTTFGNGTGQAQVGLPGNSCFACIAQQADGKIVVVGGGETLSIARLLPDGSPDPTFGSAGIASRANSSAFFPTSVIVTPSGRIVVGGSYSSSGAFDFAVASFLANGIPDPNVGIGGLLITDVRGSVSAITQQADGKLLLAGGAVVARLQVDGVLDPTFGSNGVVDNDSPIGIELNSIAVQANGKIVVAGRIQFLANMFQFSDPVAVVLRLDPDGNRDPSFGANGLLTFQVDSATPSTASAIALDSRQRIVIVGASGDVGASVSEDGSGFRQIVVLRLDPDGSPDAFFSAHGRTAFWDGYSSYGYSVAIQPGDRILIGGSSEGFPVFRGCGSISCIFDRPAQGALFRLQGGDGTVASYVSVGEAIEYYYAGFGHYFLTATPYEIARLDTFGGGWVRTGQSFKVWTEDAAGLSPVCRFFSGETFAPKSSHFYTPYPDECAGLKAGTAWQFERNEFDLELPQGSPGQGACPMGTAPLYRLYNNGQGGAPNHRYTDNLDIFNQMLAQGWSFEGEAQTKVFACEPAQ
jgi:uncharacterized delta-60 repeat protein